MATLVNCTQLDIFCSPISELPELTGEQLYEQEGPCLQRLNARGGVIIYYVQDGQIYLCLGRSEQNDWTDLAGGCEENELISSCCLREFAQESNGVFGDYDLAGHQDEYFLQYNSYCCLLLPLKSGLDPQECIQKFKPPENERVEVFELRWFNIQDLINSIQRRNDISLYLCLRIILINKLDTWRQLIIDRK